MKNHPGGIRTDNMERGIGRRNMKKYKKMLFSVLIAVITLFLYRFARQGIFAQRIISRGYESNPAIRRIFPLAETYQYVFTILSGFMVPLPDKTSPPPTDDLSNSGTDLVLPPALRSSPDKNADKTVAPESHMEKFIYGKSEMGRDLLCYKLSGTDSQKFYKILLVFEIHGFEDAYERDGQLLVDIAYNILNYYRNNPEKLNGCKLYIIPSANPDGLIDGYTQNGFGRCQSSGYDINREFDTGRWSQNNTPRNMTGTKPLASPESSALAGLVLSIKPDIVVDFHGWLEMYRGDEILYQYFNKFHDMKHGGSFSDASGFFAAWAELQCGRALLYEFPFPLDYSNKAHFISSNKRNVIRGLNEIFREILIIVP